MKRAATVRNGMVTDPDGESGRRLRVGGPGWESWLRQPGVTTFRVEDGAAPFTARRQSQRGHWYWYAYRRQAGRLHKFYLGRPRDITIERLEAAGMRFAAVTEAASALARDRVHPNREPLPRVRHNLPSQLSSFLGRQAESAEVRRLLAAGRIVTLTGAGGVGKTRLALHVAAALLEGSADPVWLVELAPLADPALVPQAVARAVGIREVAGQPLLTTLAAGFGAGPILLLLDNCEHLVEACAQVAEHLLRSCPDLRLLATSREPLGVPGEVAWRVPSLDLPEPVASTDQLCATPAAAVRLFVERAQAARPGFALTERNAATAAEICRRLDGIPLAIELAAAQVRVLDPEELAVRLDDRFLLLTGGNRGAPPRHRTLRATIDWSYDLLSRTERRFFDWLSVFAGGFTLAAAEGVCTASWVDEAGVFDLLSRLIDASLIQVEPVGETSATRYRLLEISRAYGADRLARRAETDQARRRHAAWFLARAEEAARAFHGPDQGFWLRWAEREHDNLCAALAWSLEHNEATVAMRLAAALSWSWLVHQRWSEGLDWVQRVLALPCASPTRERGQLLYRAIELTVFRGDLTSNRPAGDFATANRLVEECLAIGEALADDEIKWAGSGLRDLLREFGVRFDGLPEIDREEALATLRSAGHAWGVRRSLEALARDALRRGELEVAGARLREAIALARSDGDIWSLAMALNELGDIERARGLHRLAKPLYEESATLFAELGLGDQPNLMHNLGYVALAAGDRTGAAAHFAGALAQFRRLGERRGMAECLVGLGAVAVADRRLADAGRLFGAGEAALAALGTPLWPANRPDYERWLARARTSRAVADFDRARAESGALSSEQAISRAQTGDHLGEASLPASERDSPLTPRERAVARLAADGLSNRQIAVALAITDKTAANHVQHVLAKLDLRSRAQLAARAAELGVTPTEAAVPTPKARG